MIARVQAFDTQVDRALEPWRDRPSVNRVFHVASTVGDFSLVWHVVNLVYGLGVCYAFQGRKLSLSFLASQEALVVVIYYARSFVRFGYERFYKLPTQFRFWPGGGLLCLASAYLGNTLGTVGYELEETKNPEDAQRIVRMKAMLIALSLAMAFAFFTLNVVWPMKLFQSGRVMMSGIALAEILPITPMPGKKIKDWNVRVWLLLVALVVPTFVLVNFVL